MSTALHTSALKSLPLLARGKQRDDDAGTVKRAARMFPCVHDVTILPHPPGVASRSAGAAESSLGPIGGRMEPFPTTYGGKSRYRWRDDDPRGRAGRSRDQ